MTARNDLQSQFPMLATEWDFDKNASQLPSEVSSGSNKKAWWICERGHSFEATIHSRARRGSGCSYCSNRKVLSGFNDLETIFPDLAKQWHPKNNGSLLPSEVLSGNHGKYWWICEKNHEWEASLLNRTRKGYGCPICSGRVAESGKNDLATSNPKLVQEWNWEKNPLPPSSYKRASGQLVWWKCPNGHEYQCQISSRVTQGTGCGVCYRSKTFQLLEPGINDLKTIRPTLAQQWHPTKNLPHLPSAIPAKSKSLYWWICKNGHEFQCSAAKRMEGSNCPICRTVTLIPGVNDLQTTHPELAKEFDYEKNFPLVPSGFRASEKKAVWWICPSGHSYQTLSSTRKHQGTGCPVCSNHLIVPGVNDMETTHPQLASQFHPTKNSPLAPNNVAAGARRKFWWVCDLGHEWEASSSSRALMASGCPYCANKALLPGFNDLATVYPSLISEFDSEKNAPLTPTSVGAGSHKKLWWHCSHGHTWQTTIFHRVEGTGCPYCANKAAWPGFNDMATTQPELAKEFHPSLNAPDTPQTVNGQTNKKFWWLCSRGHAYQSTPQNRLQGGGTGCSICSNHQLLRGFNDMATTHPELAASWHPAKNGDLLPSDVIAGTNRKFWWLCEQGHAWFTLSSLRARGRNCPRCSVSGYDSTKPGWFYFIENPELKARKIGISNFKTKRIESYERGWATIRTWEDNNGLLILNLETNMLRWIRNELKLPPYLSKEDMGHAGGASETFSEEEISNYEVISRIEKEFSELQIFHSLDEPQN